MSAQPLEARIAHLEGAFDQFAERLTTIDRRLDAMDSRFDGRFAQIDNRLESRFTWLTGIVVGTWITTILTILFHR